MKNVRASPFAWVDGHLYLVATFTLEPDARPSLPDLLVELIQHHPPADILILRRLSEDEATAVTEALDDAAVDAWAHLVGDQEG